MRRYAGLELLRFVAAVAVLFWHYQHFFSNVPPGDQTGYVVSQLPLRSVFALFYESGHYAVQVFWAISGFIFFYRYGAAIHERRVTLGQYLVYRVSRLYPLHLLTLVAVMLLQLVFLRVNGRHAPFVFAPFDLRHFVLNVLMISQWGLQAGLSFNGPVWSVSIEEFCYLAFFFIASGLVFTRRTLALLFVAACVLRSTNPLSPEFAECLALFLVGGVVWGVHGWVIEGGAARRLGSITALGAAIIALVVIRPAYPALPPAAQIAVSRFVLIPTILFAFLALFPRDDARAGRACGELGKLTYSTYMIHFPIQLATVTVLDALGISRMVFYSPLALLLFVSTVIALGYGVFTRFEMPMQAFVRSKLLRERPRTLAEREPMLAPS